MIRPMYRLALLVGACVLAIWLALPAFASQQSDFDDVYGDWKPDLVITQCKWSQGQLENARDVAQSNPDFQYETEFIDDTQREIDRWKNGGCGGIKPIETRRTSPANGVRIASVKGRGSAKREVVTVQNRSGKTVSFRK